MPRLHSNFSRCVFFLYGQHPETGKLIGPKGTGVLIGFHDVTIHTYAVTCAHIAPQGASVIRLNTIDGKSRLIELEPDDWITPKNGADVAAVDITDKMAAGDDVRRQRKPHCRQVLPTCKPDRRGRSSIGY
jgi:hypothetical protein